MEILADANLAQLGFVGLMSFGSVGAVNFFVGKKWKLAAGDKFLMLAGFALVYGFVPADFGNVVADRIKDAVVVATSLTAAYTGLKVISGK